MYVAAHTHIPYRKRVVEDDGQPAYAAIYTTTQVNRGATINLKEVRNPYDQKTQLKPQNFKNNELERLAKKRESSTPTGPQKQKQIYKGFTQQAQKKPVTQWYGQQKEAQGQQ